MIYLITRHLGAIDWLKTELAQHKELASEQHDIVVLNHLDNAQAFQKGDIVVGILPVDKAFLLGQQGVRYFHLGMEMTAELRGKELSAAQMVQLNACLQEFVISKPN